MITPRSTPVPYYAHPADIFACWGTDPLSRAISLHTARVTGPVRWGPSHVAIACPRNDTGHSRCYWWESTGLASRQCLASEQRVRGCQVHVIRDRLQDYTQAGGTVCVYRLSPLDALTEDQTRLLFRMLSSFVGGDTMRHVAYDTKGAMLSGTRLLRRVLLGKNQLNTMFCSELLAAVLQRLGLICRQNPATYTPARLIRRLLRDGTYTYTATLSLATVCHSDGDRRCV